MQVIIKFSLDKVIDKRSKCRSIWTDTLGTQLGLGLGLKNRLLHTHSNGCNDRLTDIGGVKVLLVKLTYRLYDRFAKCRQVRAPLSGVLSIYEGVVFFSIASRVRDRHLYVIPFQMDDGVANTFLIHLIRQKVK